MRVYAAVIAGTALCVTASHRGLNEFRADRFAAPGVIVFTGKPLASPIVLSNWTENQRLMASLARPIVVPDASLRGRPRIAIAMYWGGEWSRFASTPDSLALLATIHQPQTGQYYPAFHGHQAVWVFAPMGALASSRRIVSDDAITILRKHHLPVAIE